ncbi:hypothetical protein HCN44_006649 [Aphidius gifuensis]|uniref:Thiamin pyrophosphokinase thiamin-binding domain-containing protein n=1 Tax=Aphidius gifuensis TaxID=684658 RepID=A0A834Y288_APHGI|nr:hypothetical protein HCN44_006649 [Aphidius gifuensis]
MLCVAMGNGFKSNNKLWEPSRLFDKSTNEKYAVIILNQPILFSPNVMLPIWKRAEMTMTVDGGTDRWLNYISSINNVNDITPKTNLIPQLIVGDLDSVSPNVLDKYEKLGVKIIKTPNQNLTDYSKALMEISAECKKRNTLIDAVYTFVETSGRFDHIMGIINTLYKSDKLINETETIINVASNSLTWLLKPGTHTIKIPEVLYNSNSWVGLIPFESKRNIVSTAGLKWNLDNSELEFGGMVSTSNSYDGSPEVIVTTDTKIIWSMGIEALVDSLETS